MKKSARIESLVFNAFAKSLPQVLGKGYESRRNQVEMAIDVLRCFEDDRIAVIEAETGLGKSLAYLIPLLIHCSKTNTRAVISTHTRTLQRQLIEKDFSQAVQAAGVDIEAVTLLGRTNYACKREIQRFIERGGLDTESEEWLRLAFDDDRGEIENLAWGITPDSAIKSGSTCPVGEAVCAGCRLREECHLFRARQRAIASQVVLVNHALLFSDLSTKEALLGSYDLLVIDEAHHLYEAAIQFFTLSFSVSSIKGSSYSLYTNTYEEIVAYAREIISAQDMRASKEIERLWKSFHDSLQEAYQSSNRFFEQLSARAHYIFTDPRRPANSISGNSHYRYREDSPIFYDARAESDRIKENLNGMASATARLIEISQESPVLSDTGVTGSLRVLRDATKEVIEAFDFIVSASDDDYVFYAEVASSRSVTALYSSPIDVSSQLGAFLEEKCRSALLTSATLAVGDDFSYTMKQLGVSGSPRAGTARYESPFDMERQRTVFLASFLPDPCETGFLEKVSEAIACLAEALPRKMLVLCTSRTQLRWICDFLYGESNLRRRILAQVGDASRSELIERFKHSSEKKILLGLASFWEGVDFPGKLLEIVVVVKMPFLVPTEPVSQARAEKLQDVGEDPFWEYVIPNAVLKLRQGFGRLIRTSSDRGAVIILDARLKSRVYGDFVLEAVSNRVIRCDQLEGLVMEVRNVFNREGV